MQFFHSVLLLLLVTFVSCSKEKEASIFELQLGKDDLQSVQIQRATDPPFTVPTGSGATARSGQPLDPEKLLELREALRTLTFSEGFAAETDQLERFGLAEPRLIARLSLSSLPPFTIYFGEHSSYTGKRYVLLTSRSKVFLAAESLYDALNKDESYFTDPVLARFPISDTCRFDVRGPSLALQFAREERGWIQRRDGVQYAADRDSVHSILTNIQFLRSKQVVPASAFGAPLYRITVELCDGEKHTVELSHIRQDAFDVEGEPLRLRVSSLPDLVFEIARQDAPILVPAGVSFRRDQPFRVSLAEVQEAQFINLESPRVFVRQPDGWSVNRQPGDAPFIEGVLEEIAAVTAERYVSPDSELQHLTATNPFLQIRFLNVEGEALLEGTIWHDEKSGRFFAWDEHFKELFEISRSTIPRILPKLEVLVPVE